MTSKTLMRKLPGNDYDFLLKNKQYIKNRKDFADIVEKYIKDSSDCISVYNNTIFLTDKTGSTPRVIFKQRIGSKSTEGEAYLTTSISKDILQFASKIMPYGKGENDIEVEILKKCKKLVGKFEFSPNLPLLYASKKCSLQCKSSACPKPSSKGQYYIVINELASMDLESWYKTVRTVEEHVSVITQIIFGIRALHMMGYYHQDLHLGNLLIHEVPPGGYWCYLINNKKVYVPNKGYLVVLWDFGTAAKIPKSVTKDTWLEDYYHPLRLMTYIEYDDMYVKAKLKPPPNSVGYFLSQIFDAVEEPDDPSVELNEKNLIDIILQLLKNSKSLGHILKFGSVSKTDKVLNMTPYLDKRTIISKR